MQIDNIEGCKWEILNRILIHESIDATRKRRLPRRPWKLDFSPAIL